METRFRDSVLTASHRPEILQAIDLLYTDVQREIDLRRPICQISGRCCRFEEFGHRLFVTTIELAAFTAQLARRPAENPGGCPFQSGKFCGVHAIRPFGCRIFFCDSTSTDWQMSMYERFHSRLKRLHEDLSVPYFYLEWREALERMSF